METIVAVGGDPGGANALSPVLNLLAQQGRVRIRALAYNEARTLWFERSISVEELSPETRRSTILETVRGTDLLLTGTSMNSLEFEKQFIAASREVGVPSLTVLDFWSHYRRRFSDTTGSLIYLPDRIAVMDDQAHQAMIDEGIDRSRLFITGQPAFDNLAECRQSFTAQKREHIRQTLGVRRDDLLVAFASQPLARLFGSDDSNPLYLGYDETTAMKALIPALERVAVTAARPVTLLILPHPREDPNDFDHYQSDVVTISVARKHSARDLVMSADLVAGMNSNLLVEACYLGCIVVSLQPGLRMRDALPTNHSGFSHAVYREQDVEPEIAKMLMDGEARAAMQRRVNQFQLVGGAAARVVKLVYQMIGIAN